MKVLKVTILFFALLLMSLSSQAQLFKGMVMLGGNLSQIDGDQSKGFNRIGLNAGVGVMFPLTRQEKFDILLSSEILYNQLGAKESEEPFKYNTRLDYASIPFMVHIDDKKGGWMFGLGVQYSRLFKVSEDWGLPDTIKWLERPVLTNIKDFNKDDFSFIADVRFRIWEKFKFNVRYQYSLTPIRKDVEYFNGFPIGSPDRKTWIRNFYNSALSFRLIYVINERNSRELDRNINRNAY